MEKTYKITDKKLEEAATIITSNGGSVHSDTEKPSLASWKMIEGKLDEFFEDSK